MTNDLISRKALLEWLDGASQDAEQAAKEEHHEAHAAMSYAEARTCDKVTEYVEQMPAVQQEGARECLH